MLLYNLFLMSFYQLTFQFDVDITSFTFKTNRIYGNTLPQTVTIEVHYNIEYSTIETETKLKLKNAPPTKRGGTIALTVGPYMCTEHIDQKITEASSVSTFNRLNSKLKTLRESLEIPEAYPIIAVSDCLNLRGFLEQNLRGEIKDNIYTANAIFNVTHVFKRFDTILFVDSFNVVPFHYLPNHDPRQSLANNRNNDPVSCDLTIGDQIPFRISPRPTCPSPEMKDKVFSKGLLKTYIPNKIVETHKAYKCYIQEQAIESSVNAIGIEGYKYVARQNFGINETECRKWIQTKLCTIYRRGPERCGGGHFATYELKRIKLNNRFYGSHNPYDYRCPPRYRFLGYTLHTFYVPNCMYEQGEIYATPPMFDLTSSFGAIPSSRLNESNHTNRNGITIIWDKFYPSDLCMWSLKSKANAKKITYHTADILNQDRNPNVKEVIMYVADDIHQAVQTDNTLQVDARNLNCISVDSTNKIEAHTNVDGSELYVFLEGVSTNMQDGVQHGLQSAHKRMQVVSDNSKSTVHHSSSFRSMPPLDSNKNNKIMQITLKKSSNNEKIQKRVRRETINESSDTTTSTTPIETADSTVNETIHPAINGTMNSTGNDKLIDSSISKHDIDKQTTENDTKKRDSVQDLLIRKDRNKVSLEDTINYLAWHNQQLDEERLEQRALQNCYNLQFAHDAFIVMMKIDPSTTLSNRLGMTVLADEIGNGHYAYQICEPVTIIRVIENLFTISSQTFTLNKYNAVQNSSEMRISDYIRSKNVKIDPIKCLSQPLIIFQNKLTRIEYIGQLMPNDQINTKNIPFLERCETRLHEKIFRIRSTVYRFLRYKLVKQERISTEKEISKKIVEKDLVARNLIHDRTDNTFELPDILEIPVIPPKVHETPVDHIMTGLVGHTMYNATENQSSLKSLTRLVEFNIAAKETERQYTQNLLPEESFYSSGLSLDGDSVFKIGELIGEGTMGVVTGLISGADDLVNATGHLAENVVHTAGGGSW